jgi:hypothetical protein
MVNKIVKISLLIIIFGFVNISFAFDAESTHPALTEEIVKYYNSFAERKINAHELELLKKGSTLEDNSPRWINHFYDVINNRGLAIETFRGDKALFNMFLKTLPAPPLKTPEWSQDEISQTKYLANRTYQLAKREYFNNKDLAFLSLGHLLHLLADMGVPDHARGDSHTGMFGDPKSNYEEYAKKITDNYNLTFAKYLIENKIQPYNYKDLNSIFDSLARFTATNWFSEDTIGKYVNIPSISQLNYDPEGGLFYYNNHPALAKKEVEKDNKIIIVFTSADDRIHYQWFNAVVPEVIKHGANLLNLYFSEIKEMEKEEALKFYEEDIGRRLNFTKFFNFWSYLPSYAKAEAWILGESAYKKSVSLVSSLSSIYKTEISKDYWKPEKTEEVAYEEKTKTTETKYEEKTKYEERKIGKAHSTMQANQQSANSQQQPTNSQQLITQQLITQLITTSTTTTQQTQTITTERHTPPPTYSVTSKTETSKDPCADYKNKSYPNILISEIKVEGNNSKDEYIELYNPNDDEVDLTCWYITKVSSEKNESTLLPASKFKAKIQPKNFLLIAHPSSTVANIADLTYASSYSIAKNNSIILKKPNGDISDLVGFGTDKSKISQYEEEPFIASTSSFATASIQRLSLKDTNNNSKDFFLYQPTPKTTREDFADLRDISIDDFSVNFDLENSTLTISFTEPDLNIATTNYSYDILISTSSEFSTYKLKDFGIEDELPKPKFRKEKYNYENKPTKCPLQESNWYFGLYLFDNLIPENKTKIFATSVDLGDFCLQEQLQQPPSGIAKEKILISEVGIIKEKGKEAQYIELYNPNNKEINLKDWVLEKLDKNGNGRALVSSSTRESKFDESVKIAPFSYLLIAKEDSNLNIQPDLKWAKSYSLAKDNSIRLINDKNEIVDLVGWGNAKECEGECYPENPENKALVRKAGTSSTETSMKNEEKDFGNSYDTDNNKIDFILMDPEPQNSSSTLEIPPDYITKLTKNINNNILTLDFVSPYQKLENAKYEIRVGDDWNNAKIVDTQLPEVKPYGEETKIEIDLCKNEIKKGDKILIGIIKEEQLLNSTSTEIDQDIVCKNAKLTIYFRDKKTREKECGQFGGEVCWACYAWINDFYIKNKTLNFDYSSTDL